MSNDQELPQSSSSVELEDRSYLTTEQTNSASEALDTLSPLELVDLFNQEDLKTIEAIAAARESLATVIELAADCLTQGGRLFYVGAGTSGRLGVLDASECPPTFCTPPEMVQGIIAGGADALIRSSEALEDNAEDGARVIDEKQVSSKDIVIGITAGGTTPYVHGAVKRAKGNGAKTAFIACVPQSQVSAPGKVDADVRLVVGPELLTGSTRLKAGTATKMALNIISTGTMVLLGKVYENQMIDVSVTNSKLRDRAVRIISKLANISRHLAGELLQRSGNQVKLALLMHWRGLDNLSAKESLDQNHGNLRKAHTSQID
ncbi:MAG: N-acetylmuramic acid 6-phosphate etherase [Cyanobacteria bacterium P01_D01_bin.73]